MFSRSSAVNQGDEKRVYLVGDMAKTVCPFISLVWFVLLAGPETQPEEPDKPERQLRP
jgi:hypothetical protein